MSNQGHVGIWKCVYRLVLLILLFMKSTKIKTRPTRLIQKYLHYQKLLLRLTKTEMNHQNVCHILQISCLAVDNYCEYTDFLRQSIESFSLLCKSPRFEEKREFSLPSGQKLPPDVLKALSVLILCYCILK